MADAALERLIPECRVLLAGSPIPPETDAALTRVSVDLDVDLFGQCVLTFHDPKLALINGSDFRSGTAVKVELGFAANRAPVFEGEVVALEPKFRRDVPPSLTVVCQETLHRLALSSMTRSFNDVDDKEIVTIIAREHGLSAEGPAGTRGHALQSNVTDAVFLRRLSQNRGHHLRIEGSKLILGPPASGPQIVLGPGSGISKAKVKINAKSQVKEISVHGWDPKTKREILGKATAQGETGGAQHGGAATLSFSGHELAPADPASAEAMAKGRLRKLNEGFVKARITALGNAKLVPGAEVKIDGVSAQLDGTWRVEHAAHEFSKRGYWVELNAVRIAQPKPPKPIQPAPQAPAQPPPATPQQQPAAPPQAAPGQHIEVKVLDPMGNPKSNFFFKLTRQGQPEQAGMTDAEGFVRLDLPAAGQWRLFFPDVDGAAPQGS